MTPDYPFSEPVDLSLDSTYALLRRTEPVTRVRFPFGGEGWLVTSYQEAKAVLGDARFSRAAAVGRDVPRMVPSIDPGGVLITQDGADHRRMRGLVSQAFTVRRVEEMRPGVLELAEDLVDGLNDPDDLVERFAAPLAITTICELLGVPCEDRELFRGLSDRWMTVGAYTPEESANGLQHLLGYFGDLAAKRRAEPTDDLFSALVQARDGEGSLSDHELVALGMALLVAGCETTVNMIGNSVVAVVEHPEVAERLRAEPELVPQAVEELLRFIPLGSGAVVPDIATEDLWLGGVLVRKGDAVLVSVGSANQDETVYPDATELRLDRQVGQHLGFGHGIHYCLGAPLARMELQVALGVLLRRLPELRLAAPVEFRRGGYLRGPRALLLSLRGRVPRDAVLKVPS